MSSRAPLVTSMHDTLARMAAGGRAARSVDNMAITNKMLDVLGLQQALRDLKFVHITGTKGKGTTSTYCANLLQHQGKKVGLFTSPHLVDVRERIRINNTMIDEVTFAQHFFDIHKRLNDVFNDPDTKDEEVRHMRDHVTRFGFFRFLFALSIHIFAHYKVDIAVLEVGIGGKIDSTNVVLPEACGVTSVGYDHMDILGDTIEEIATDKSGIIKPSIPVFVSPQTEHPEAEAVFRRRAEEVGAPFHVADNKFLDASSWGGFAMAGDHMIQNARLALVLARAVESSDLAHIRKPVSEDEYKVLQETTYAGRSQIIRHTIPQQQKEEEEGEKRVTYFVDGAHTPESIHAATTWFLKQVQQRAASAAHKSGGAERNVMVLYSTRELPSLFEQFSKNEEFTSRISKVFCIHITSEEDTVSDKDKELVKAQADQWNRMFCGGCCPAVAVEEPISSEDALLRVIRDAGEDGSSPLNVFVTGSLHLCGHILRAIGEL